VIVMTVQTALLSPPVALSLYVVATVIGCSMRDANRECGSSSPSCSPSL